MKLKRNKRLSTALTAVEHLGYARVSTDQQSEEGVSLEAQANKLRADALHREVEIEILTDHVSGGSLQRPAMQELLARVKAGKVASVAVYKLDRLTRSVYDLLYLVELLEKTGTAFVSLSEKLDTSTATGRMFVQIIGVIAEWERGVIAERTRDALRHKRSQGVVYGPIPYGFDRIGDNLVRNEQELLVVSRIIGMIDAGESLRAVATALNRDGIPTKNAGRVLKRNHIPVGVATGKWLHMSVERVLRNRELYGTGV